MKNIHVLPTDKPSRLFENTDGGLSIDDELQPNGIMCQNQNIYITSDEEIKEGDWFISLYSNSIQRELKLDWTLNKDAYKKITLTTDKDLIKDGIQAIDNEFLEWFVKNQSCEEVEVQKFFGFAEDYLIIIPKEEPNPFEYTNTNDFTSMIYNSKEEPKQTDWKDSTKTIMEAYGDNPKDFPYEEPDYTALLRPVGTPMISDWLEQNRNPEIDKQVEKEAEELSKQETLEEAAERLYPDCNNVIRQMAKETFIKGAKWSQERSYSEEEVIAFGEFIFKHSLLTHTRGVKSLFETFKNK